MIRRYQAYHKEKKVMIDVSEIDFRKQRIKGRAGDEIISARFDEVNLYQSTGLFDKAKQELFEGDYIKGRDVEKFIDVAGKIEYEGGEYKVINNVTNICKPLGKLISVFKL